MEDRDRLTYERPWYTRSEFMKEVALFQSGNADPLDWLGEGFEEVSRRVRMIRGIEEYAYYRHFSSIFTQFPSWDIPTGVLSNRAFNCLMRSGINSMDELNSQNMSMLYSIRNAGKKTVDEIIQLMISMYFSDDSEHSSSNTFNGDSDRDVFVEIVSEEFLRYLKIVVDWARWRRSATTWGDILALHPSFESRVPDDVMDAWDQFSTMNPPKFLGPSTSVLDASKAINDKLNDLDDRARHVFMVRTLKMPDNASEMPSKWVEKSDISPNLEDLGILYGVSRERIRQIQQKAEQEMHRMLAREHSIQWLALDIPAMLGVAFPLDALVTVPALGAMAMTSKATDLDHEVVRRAMVWFAGFVLTRRDFGLSRGGWALREGVDPSALRHDLQEQALAAGVLSYTDIKQFLVSRGVVRQVVDDIVGASLPGLKRFGDSFLPWEGARTDKVAALLHWLGRPSTDDELLELLGDYISPASARGLRTRLLNDNRFMKMAKNTFALRERATKNGDPPA